MIFFFLNVLEWRSQYEKVNGDDSPILGPYDYYSLMHYEIRAPGTDLPAFEVLRKSINHSRIGQRVAQTHNDKHKIKRLYR
ncbi:hypothetical protein AVEN_107131-1 [Araneus ventricosus]|uniref:Peptidase M12A domain-containing protein n=1 Tax=Araneus ventricosus TaxID=182803 RepID=A0A4Y2XBH5_ARAVE|nr:hypothetical protein AVEN_107131-1 [Araneus ventricosus]